ncbi:MAG: hypothetical protein Q9168_000402 [Polycauliona sp. 1 TL-2023]
MYSSTLLVVSFLPLFAFSLPQGGILPGPSELSAAVAASSTVAAATALVTGTAIPTSNGTYDSTSGSSIGTATASASAIAPADTSIANNAAVIGQLLLAAKAVDRIKLIPQDTSFKFDFDAPPADTLSEGKGGRTVRADRKSFPPLVGTGASMALGFLGPCGFNTPHTHPRSAEINLVVQGSLKTEFTLENGARTIHNTLALHQMTVFPQGALHTEFNPDCDDAIFVAGFASEDPGVQQTAQAYFGFDQDIVEAATGNDFTFEGKDVDEFRKLIPANVALGVESCLKKCGINRR